MQQLVVLYKIREVIGLEYPSARKSSVFLLVGVITSPVFVPVFVCLALAPTKLDTQFSLL